MMHMSYHAKGIGLPALPHVLADRSLPNVFILLIPEIRITIIYL